MSYYRKAVCIAALIAATGACAYSPNPIKVCAETMQQRQLTTDEMEYCRSVTVAREQRLSIWGRRPDTTIVVRRPSPPPPVVITPPVVIAPR